MDACELVVSQEIFLSETAQLADVVLPAASFLEKDGTFVNFDRRFQRVRPALPPPGQARTDFDIIHAVAAALGADLGCRTPADALAECARLAPLFAGICHDRLDREGPLHWPCRSADDPGEATLYLDRFATPDGRAQLAARPTCRRASSPTPNIPFILITGRRLEHYNAGTMTRRTPNLDAAARASAWTCNPDDAARLGRRRRRPGRGRPAGAADPRSPSSLTDEVAPGQVFLAFHFPDAPANLLTSEQTDEDTVTSCPEYKVTAVRLVARNGAAGD